MISFHHVPHYPTIFCAYSAGALPPYLAVPVPPDAPLRFLLRRPSLTEVSRSAQRAKRSSRDHASGISFASKVTGPSTVLTGSPVRSACATARPSTLPARRTPSAGARTVA